MPAKELRHVFNDGDYQGRLTRGQLVARIIADNHPSKSKAREPYCTRSQVLQYRRTDGAVVALVHRYLRQDGTLGASGVVDPKRIYLASEILSAQVEPVEAGIPPDPAVASDSPKPSPPADEKAGS